MLAVVALALSAAVLGSVAIVALAARTVALRAIDAQLAWAAEREDNALRADLRALSERVAKTEASVRDISVMRATRR